MKTILISLVAVCLVACGGESERKCSVDTDCTTGDVCSHEKVDFGYCVPSCVEDARCISAVDCDVDGHCEGE